MWFEGCAHRRHVPPVRNLLDGLLDLGLLPLEVVRDAVEHADVLGLHARRRVHRVDQLHLPVRRLAVQGVGVRAPLSVDCHLIVVKVQGLGLLLLRRLTRRRLRRLLRGRGLLWSFAFRRHGGSGKAGTILEMTERWPPPV